MNKPIERMISRLYRKLNLKSWILLGFILVGLLSSCAENERVFTTSSPDGNLTVQLTDTSDTIKYELFWKGERIVNSSEISILPGVAAKIKATNTSSKDEIWTPVWGQFSEIKDQYHELSLDIELQGASAKLIARVYDGGLGFRYELMNYEEGAEATLVCEYNLAADDAIYSPAGEQPPLGPLLMRDLMTAQERPKLRMPIVVETQVPYLSILESDLFSAPGFEVIQLAFDQEKGSLVSSNKAQITDQTLVTPWRVILVNDLVGDLVTNTVTLNLAAPNQVADSDWIKPGKTLWDWRVHGYTAPDGFTYGVNTESYLRFIDFAAEKGIEYFLIDDSWYDSVSTGHFELSEKLNLQKVIDYASEKGVGLMLYYDRKNGEYGDETLFDYYQSLGMKGMKYGFMGTDVDFTREAITASAESQLLIDFHDGPVPFTGVERTFPNAITKEYCHAQQDSRRAFTPETFINMALINAIQGPLDMNNGNFDLTGINSGIRQKSPKIPNSYLSTVMAEAARPLIIHSGLVCIPDAPEAYREKADLFEFIQKLPVGKWDESRVLNAKIGEHITTARRHGNEWFVGSSISQKGGKLDINLDFLEEGKVYKVTLYEDTPETHCVDNPEAYQIRTIEVRAGEIFTAQLAPGGGHCMWIRPKAA